MPRSKKISKAITETAAKAWAKKRGLEVNVLYRSSIIDRMPTGVQIRITLHGGLTEVNLYELMTEFYNEVRP